MSLFNPGGRPEKLTVFDGKKMTAKQIMEETGLPYMTVYRKYFQKKKEKKVKPAKAAKRCKTGKKLIASAEKLATVDIPPEIVDAADQPAPPEIPDPPAPPAPVDKKQTPLEYMLSVINDPEADDNRRDRMAAAAAPYLHPKANVDKNKKDQAKERASEAGKGKFATGQAPKLVKIGRK